MNFRQKLIAYSAAVTASLAFAPGLTAGEVMLDYESFPVGSEAFEHYWTDMAELAVQHGHLEPRVLVARFAGPEGREMVATVLASAGACGLNECPVRIFEGTEKVADFNVCSNTETHAVNGTGSLFMACDAIVDIGRR